MITEEVQAAEAAAREAASGLTHIRVLLIEDNPGDARLIQVMLRDSDAGFFSTEHVDRLELGIQRLAAGDIDIVLVDLSLPDSQSLATFARLHAFAPHVPIVVLTGLDDTT